MQKHLGRSRCGSQEALVQLTSERCPAYAHEVGSVQCGPPFVEAAVLRAPSIVAPVVHEEAQSVRDAQRAKLQLVVLMKERGF